MKIKILKIILLLEIILFVFFVFNTVIEINNPNNTVHSYELYSSQEIEDFNSEWETYRGSNRSAGEVSTMIGAVISNNVAETNYGTERIINVNNVKPVSVPIVSNTTTYTVTLEYDYYGFVTNINTNPIITIIEDSRGGE